MSNLYLDAKVQVHVDFKIFPKINTFKGIVVMDGRWVGVSVGGAWMHNAPPTSLMASIQSLLALSSGHEISVAVRFIPSVTRNL